MKTISSPRIAPHHIPSAGRSAAVDTVRNGRGPISGKPSLTRFIQAQVINTRRDVASLRPFHGHEFGSHPASPTPAHIAATNQLMTKLRARLLHAAQGVNREAEVSSEAPTTRNLHALLRRKQVAQGNIKAIEKIWDFYLELFGQRQSRFGDMLLGTDRIALDCYQTIYAGLDKPKSIPSPAPFSYMETGFTPATFRRGIRLSKLGRNINPFPIVSLPYHRMVNPWTLGAVHHEVAHNLQSDLGMWQEVPQRIMTRLRRAGLPHPVAQVWGRWHKETWADLAGTLLGGPGIVTSLFDVLARAPRSTGHFNPAGVHPTPYLRALISTELLRRMGFANDAAAFEQLWEQMYPMRRQRGIPAAMRVTFPTANRLVVDTICFQPYRQLGGKSLADIFIFNQNHQQMTAEAAHRMAKGIDPGIIPARFLVGAARYALDNKLASSGQIARNFYQALARR